MARTTRADLDHLERRLELTLHGQDWLIQYAYGQPRLLRKNGSINVSPRLPAGRLKEWIEAYLEGALATVELTNTGVRS